VDKKSGLSPQAFEVIPGDEYQPYIPAETGLAEFTLRAVVLGALFGIMFGAANAYLGLKVGLTVSTSIPVAVMSVGFFKAMQNLWRRSSILEWNISQTVGSASSSLASGIIFTIPALYLWGLDPGVLKIAIIGCLGGLLGVLFMIPLRRYLISSEHGKLPYPEGTACAEVLVASDAGGSKAKTVFAGLGVGLAFKWLMAGLHLWKDHLALRLPVIRKAEIGMELTPALVGVGYILGYRVSAIMLSGSLFSWIVVIPLIAHFGHGLTSPMFPEVDLLISQMEPGQIWTRYIRYLGAGGVACGGFITLIKAIPTIIESFRRSMHGLRQQMGENFVAEIRTQRDLPLKFVLAGVAVIILTIAAVPHIIGTVESFGVRVLGAFCMAAFAFFFVTVSSRIVGLIGVTSNPTSGMTIATLLITSSLFVLFGWTDDTGKFAALIVGTVVAIAASIAGDTSQDLKTGFLIGATPSRQQIGEIIGVLTSVIAVSASVIALHKVYGFGSAEIPAPQANMMKIVIEGVLQADIPWGLVLIGAALAGVVELLGLPSLPFAVGVYLPVSTFTPIFIGGIVRRLAEARARSDADLAERRERGVLFGSGLVAGDGLLGVGIAFYALFGTLINSIRKCL